MPSSTVRSGLPTVLVRLNERVPLVRAGSPVWTEMMRVVSRQAPEGALMVAFPRRRFGLVRLPTGHLPDEATGSQDTVTCLNTSTGRRMSRRKRFLFRRLSTAFSKTNCRILRFEGFDASHER